MDVDNNTETTLFTIFDNTIPLTVTYYINVASTTADTLAIDEVGNGVPYTVIDNANANANANANGGVTLYRTTFLTPSGVLSIFGTVDVKANSDNKNVANGAAKQPNLLEVCDWKGSLVQKENS